MISRREVVLGAVGLAMAPPASNELPKPNWRDVPGYLAALKRSRSPAVKALMDRISSGPQALKREREAWRAAGLPGTPGELLGPSPSEIFEILCIRAARKGNPTEVARMLDGLEGFDFETGKYRPVRTGRFTEAQREFVVECLDAREAEILRTSRNALTLLARPPIGRTAAIRAMDAGVNRHDPTWEAALSNVEWFARMAERELVRTQQRDVLIAGAKILGWRARNGAYPVNLAEAITPAPMDLFTGNPLRYARTEQGFEVASVGPEPRPSPDMPGTALPRSQIVFRYPRQRP